MAGLGSYEAVGTPFQAMINLSLKAFCDNEVLSFEYKMLSGAITIIAEKRSWKFIKQLTCCFGGESASLGEILLMIQFTTMYFNNIHVALLKLLTN